MTEYEELRELIKDRVGCYTRTTEDTEALTNITLSVIAERCWLKISEGALIDYLRYLKGEGRISPEAQKRNEIYANPYKLGKELYEWVQTAGYCMVKEIKKEIKG